MANRKRKPVKCTEYKKKFEAWNKNRTPLRYPNKGETLFTYIPLSQEQEEFRQCYLPDTSKNENIPFFKVRHVLPPYWFVSNRGYIVSAYNDIILYTGQVNQENRLQVKFKDVAEIERLKRLKKKVEKIPEKVLPYEAIKAMCFPESLKYPEKKALEMIMKTGLKAFNSQEKLFVELHHDNKYIFAETKADALKNLPENSNVEHLSFLTVNVHDILDGLGGEMDPDKISEKICTAVDKANITQPLIIFPGDKQKAGKIINLIDESNNDFLYAIEPKLKRGAWFPQLVKELLKNQYIEQKHPVRLSHVKIDNSYYEITIFRRSEEDYRYIYKIFGLLFMVKGTQQ